MPELTSNTPKNKLPINVLKDKKEQILRLWEERCLNEVPAASSSDPLLLRDSVPLYLDLLNEALATNSRKDFRAVRAQTQEATRIGKMHGADRANNKHYFLNEVIFEYHILRKVIFEALEKDAPVPEFQRDVILYSIEQAVNDAAVEFSDTHAEVQQKFINTLTHDLKNPITAAKANAELLLKNAETPESSAKCARRVIRNLNRLTDMIHDLLDASRIRAGETLSLQFIKCDLDSTIRDVVDEMAIVHGNRFRWQSPGSLEGRWDCDAIRRAVENLIGNAIKYGLPDSPIQVRLDRLENGARLTVHNEGAGIPEAEIPFLFEQHRRAKSVQEGTQTGWGLGLTLVKGVVDAHKGQIRVESVQDKGTSFILDLPSTEERPRLSA